MNDAQRAEIDALIHEALRDDERLATLTPNVRAAVEDGIRIGLGLAIRTLDDLLVPEERRGIMDEIAAKALEQARDAFRELSAEFTL